MSTWLRATLTDALTYRGLSVAVMNSVLDRGDDLVSAWYAELSDVGAALLSLARQSGAVVADVLETNGLRR